MSSPILTDPALIIKVRRIAGRRWLLKFILPLVSLVVLAGCSHNEIVPRQEQAATAGVVNNSPELANRAMYQVGMAPQQTIVTVKHPSCVLTLWNKVLRIDSENGYYLLPYESTLIQTPSLMEEERYLVTYQVIPPDDRFLEPGMVYCMGVPGDYEGGFAVRILAMQRLASHESHE